MTIGPPLSAVNARTASSMGIASPPAGSAGRWPHLLAGQTGQRLGVDAGLEGEEAGVERFRLWVPQPVPSPARRKAVAWSMAARVARVSLSELRSMKSWMVPS